MKVLAQIKALETKLASGGGDKPLHCDMKADCEQPVAYMDEKGYVYCDKHGIQRKHSMRCRKLTSKEIDQLKSGKPLENY